jgi:hypothetical protein
MIFYFWSTVIMDNKDGQDQRRRELVRAFIAETAQQWEDLRAEVIAKCTQEGE